MKYFHKPGSYCARTDSFSGPVGCFVVLTNKRFPADSGFAVWWAETAEQLTKRLQAAKAAGDIQ